MANRIIGPEQGAELKRLCAEHAAAVARAGSIACTKGMESPEFLAADKEAGALWSRINEIVGTDGEDWMA